MCLSVCSDVNLILCTKPGQVAKSAAPVLADETAVLDEEDCKDPFLPCDELEEDETVIDDD